MIGLFGSLNDWRFDLANHALPLRCWYSCSSIESTLRSGPSRASPSGKCTTNLAALFGLPYLIGLRAAVAGLVRRLSISSTLQARDASRAILNSKNNSCSNAIKLTNCVGSCLPRSCSSPFSRRCLSRTLTCPRRLPS